jgi:hypothetical protein
MPDALPDCSLTLPPADGKDGYSKSNDKCDVRREMADNLKGKVTCVAVSVERKRGSTLRRKRWPVVNVDVPETSLSKAFASDGRRRGSAGTLARRGRGGSWSLSRSKGSEAQE